MVTAASHMSDEIQMLPVRDAPYVLRTVYALSLDGCVPELLLQWSEGYSRLVVDEDSDSLEVYFHDGEFTLSADRSATEKLMPRELRFLRQLCRGPRTKKELAAPAKVLGAATRNGFGKHGGLLARGLIRSTGERVHGSICYEITDKGRSVLAASEPWQKLIGKECGWTWVTINQQGYRDGVLLSFSGIVPSVMLHVIASSIEVFRIVPG